MRKVHAIPLFEQTGSSVEQENQIRRTYVESQAPLYDSAFSASLIDTARKADQIFQDGMRQLQGSSLANSVNIHTDLHPRNEF